MSSSTLPRHGWHRPTALSLSLNLFASSSHIIIIIEFLGIVLPLYNYHEASNAVLLLLIELRRELDEAIVVGVRDGISVHVLAEHRDVDGHRDGGIVSGGAGLLRRRLRLLLGALLRRRLRLLLLLLCGRLLDVF